MAAICDMALGRLADCRYFLGIVHVGQSSLILEGRKVALAERRRHND